MSTNGQYRIVKKIGEGGMGMVYLAEDVLIQRQVAIKSLHQQQTISADQAERFQQEALALARLNHSNITHLYSFLLEENNYKMVMEYVEGKTLEAWVDGNGSINVVTACSIIVQILNGLEHAHQKGIIHRDLKPSNIMISAEGEVKIMDFGIARIRNSQRLTQQGKSVGTLAYMAPEQIQGKEGDELTDVYATGSILYEMLSGTPPFRNETDYHLMKDKLEQKVKLNTQIQESTDPVLQQVLLKSLETNPQKRYTNAQAFREAILNAMPDILTGNRLQQALESNEHDTIHRPLAKGTLFSLQSGLTATAFKKFIQPLKKLDKPVQLLITVTIVCGVLIVWNTMRTSPVIVEEATKSYSVNLEDISPDKRSGGAGIIEAQLIENRPSHIPTVIHTDSNSDTPTDQPEKPITPKKIQKKETLPQTPVHKDSEKGKQEDSIAEVPVEEEKPLATPNNTVNRKTVQIPANTSIQFILEEAVSSENKQRDGQLIRLTVADNVVVNGQTIVTKGAEAIGKIVDVEPSAKRRKGLVGFVVLKVKGRDGKDIRVQSERFRLRADRDNEAAIYSAGRQFNGVLKRGVIVN